MNYPKEAKAFYMKENPDDPRTVLCDDLLAPEGYGEIIGGSPARGRSRQTARAHSRSRDCRRSRTAGIWICGSTAPSCIRVRAGAGAHGRMDHRTAAHPGMHSVSENDESALSRDGDVVNGLNGRARDEHAYDYDYGLQPYLPIDLRVDGTEIIRARNRNRTHARARARYFLRLDLIPQRIQLLQQCLTQIRHLARAPTLPTPRNAGVNFGFARCSACSECVPASRVRFTTAKSKSPSSSSSAGEARFPLLRALLPALRRLSRTRRAHWPSRSRPCSPAPGCGALWRADRVRLARPCRTDALRSFAARSCAFSFSQSGALAVAVEVRMATSHLGFEARPRLPQ